MKKTIIVCLILIMFSFSHSYATFYESLPKDIGSNSNILEILYPKEKKETVNEESYLISCMAPPGTEITLYERYDDSLFVPITVNNEAITGVVGASGLYLIDMTFKPNSTNRIMFFAQNGKKYQSEFRTIIVEESKEEEEQQVQHTVLDIKSFITDVKKSIK